MPTSILPPANEVAERYVFTGVVLFMGEGGGGFHVTITHDALDLTV